MLRLSAPALKWQVAHAVKPSLPDCMSQKSALPSAIAAGLFRIRSLISAAVGPGTGTVLSEASFRSIPWFPPPPWTAPWLLPSDSFSPPLPPELLPEPPPLWPPLPEPLPEPPPEPLPEPLPPFFPLPPPPGPESPILLETSAAEQTSASTDLINLLLIHIKLPP